MCCGGMFKSIGHVLSWAYKIIGPSDKEFVFDEDAAVYRVIFVEGDIVEVTDDGLDDPSMTDFFIVSGDPDYPSIASFRGVVFEVEVERFYRSQFSKFTIPLVMKTYPKL